MSRQMNVVEVNKFNAGLITDASPLTTPDNSSLDEDNFVLNIDGSRNRRLGMDYEEHYEIRETNVIFTDTTDINVKSFRWDNAGGDPARSISVVQVGNTLDFFQLTEDSVSAGYFHTETFPNSTVDTKFEFSVVDGLLVLVNGDKEIYILEYSDPDTITRTTKRLLIRDLFGVSDVISGVDLTRSAEVMNRPSTTTNAHTYNLRNQSWGIPRIDGRQDNIEDPIYTFLVSPDIAGHNIPNRYPSNADTVTQALYADPDDPNGRTVERFFSADVISNPFGTTRAAQGYFIIDALDRGTSRLSENTKNMARYPDLSIGISNLPRDETPKGPTTIAEFAGRVFYAGFPGEVIDGDDHSPKLSSYVLFSQVVNSTADINVCYQANDPTSKDFADILATDGGFIRINGAYGIQKMVNLGGSLLIIAKNGVWRITGGTDNGFTATSYIVEKITDRGCTCPDSIVLVNNGVMFWNDDSIYSIGPDQFGSYVSNNISFGKIQKLYDNINIDDKHKAYGMYDSYERKVRWIYYNSTLVTNPVKELVLDLQLEGFYTNTVKQLNDGVFPKPVSMYLGYSYEININEDIVTVNGITVTVNGDSVVLGSETLLGVNQRELGYIVITSINGNISYTFAKYSNPSFRDWFSENGVGVDADAYLITSYLSGTDFQRNKQIPYITVHLRRTETGYDSNMNPMNASSCMMQSRWDWADSNKSNKWSREFQVYRYRRLYLPQNSSDDYDNGFATIVSKNKLRGTGKVLSLKFRTEPDKNLHLYGWSMLFSVAGTV